MENITKHIIFIFLITSAALAEPIEFKFTEAESQRIAEAISKSQGRPEIVDGQPNSESKVDFTINWMIKLLESYVTRHEYFVAEKAIKESLPESDFKLDRLKRK